MEITIHNARFGVIIRFNFFPFYRVFLQLQINHIIGATNFFFVSVNVLFELGYILLDLNFFSN